MEILKTGLLSLALVTLFGCSQLYHVQLSDIDQSQGELSPISIEVNELGFDAATTTQIGSEVVKNSNASDSMEAVAVILALLNMGPRTGNPVYDSQYSGKIMQQLNVQCPSYRLTGLTSVREATSFGTISGEVVRVDGYCIK